MSALSASEARWLADAILIAHVGVVLFVVGGEGLFLLGGWRGWSWVRHFWLRAVHLALMVFITLETWIGAYCPLTTWEQVLRTHAGERSYSGAFIAHWLSRWLYVQAPWWVFIVVYTAFALLVAATWYRVAPRRAPLARRQ